jgi:hypothetical protein
MVARDGIGLSRGANEICNLQILKGAGSAQSARMPKRSCKSLAKFILWSPFGDLLRVAAFSVAHAAEH